MLLTEVLVIPKERQKFCRSEYLTLQKGGSRERGPLVSPSVRFFFRFCPYEGDLTQSQIFIQIDQN